MKRFRFFAEFFVALDVAITAVIANKIFQVYTGTRNAQDVANPRSQIRYLSTKTGFLPRVTLFGTTEETTRTTKSIDFRWCFSACTSAFHSTITGSFPEQRRLVIEPKTRPPGRVYLICVAFWRENSNNLESDFTSVDI